MPNKYASQLALPALLYINGMISAAVIVGEISAIAIAVTPLKPRQLARNPVSVSLFSIACASPDHPLERGAPIPYGYEWKALSCLIGNCKRYAYEVITARP